MNKINSIFYTWTLKIFKTIGLILAMGLSMGACSDTSSWKEEVLLHDGSKIIVTRVVERGGQHEIGQKPPYKEQSLTFVLPDTAEKVEWLDKFNPKIGSANFLPILLDVIGREVYLVVSPMGCLSYNNWGRPNPPYIIFKYKNKQWKRITIQALPIEFKVPNLIISSPDTKVEKSGQLFISAEMIKQFNQGFKQPEFKSIVREPIKHVGCRVLVPMEGVEGGWQSPDFPKASFSKTPDK